MIDKRAVLKGVGAAGVTLSCGGSGCDFDDAHSMARQGSAEHSTDIASYKMPTEDAQHERTFMQWPNSLDVYDVPQLRQVQDTIALIAKTIARFEPVVMLAGAGQMGRAQAVVGPDVEVWDVPTEDLWARDAGPTFVKNGAGELAIAHLAFNGWGNKQRHQHDGKIAQRIATRLGLPLIETGLVGEQGGVEHDGNGLVLAHASSWVNPNRNRMDQSQIGEALLKALGGQKMIWAPGVIGADITDYHIDALARFVGPGHVVIQLPKVRDSADPWSVSAFETYDILKHTTDVAGRPLRIDVVPEPINIRSQNAEFVASYVNYYVCNGAVISAQFGDSRADGQAREMLSGLYPGREIVTLNVDPLGESGGGIHCATQQQPKAGIILHDKT